MPSGINKDRLKHSLKRINNQYDQIMFMAKKNQERGINTLAEGWQSPNASGTILKTVDVLNEKMEKITLQYQRLFDRLNDIAFKIADSGGGHWNSVSFDSSQKFTFNANLVSDGSGGDNTKFDEDLIIEGIGRIQQMSKNIVKNMRETKEIFKDGIGIQLKNNEFLEKFKIKMRKYADSIEQEVQEIIQEVDFKTNEQKQKLDKILAEYSVDSLSNDTNKKVSGWK